MDTSQIPSDFKEFWKLLDENKVEYLMVGGLAVNHYGYVRPTGDMDVWISRSPENAEKLIAALNQFGFVSTELDASLFTQDKNILRMGVPPIRIEILNFIDGVEFNECFDERERLQIDETVVNLISLKHLKINKRASGRLKDLADIENLS